MDAKAHYYYEILKRKTSGNPFLYLYLWSYLQDMVVQAASV